jgi:hypothetical protein
MDNANIQSLEEAIQVEIESLETSNACDLILEKYSHLQISDATEIPSPNVILKIGGEIISTEGNITTASGPSKSGKSAFTGVIIAGCIAQDDYDGFPDVSVKPAGGKAVVHLDSEQARHKHKSNLLSTLRRAGLSKCPDNLLSYNIRQLDQSKYKEATEEICQAAFDKFAGIHLIVIDGGADYIHDVNEPNQSNALVKWLEDLAIRFSTAIIVIVHVNPGSDKERGHFGSQLQRKSESVLTVKTQGDISYIEPKLLRMGGKAQIPLIQFSYSKEKGYHVYCGVHSGQNAIDARRQKEIEETAKSVFAPPASYSYSEAIDRIMKYSSKKEVTAKGIFKELKVHGLIVQDDAKNWRINVD